MSITPAGSSPAGLEEVHHQPQQKQEQVTVLNDHFHGLNSSSSITDKSNGSNSTPLPVKKKRNQPGTPDPNAEVIALSPKTLLATNRFVCEICNKGFPRDQNLQLHRRGHNLPWKLQLRTSFQKKVYVCPEPSCVHHNPARALGDLTGIKKHFCRKHGEKKWKCEKCTKKYAVQSDWKAHSKACGTKEYKCDCGAILPRRDSLMTHRAFCDASVLPTPTEENNNASPGISAGATNVGSNLHHQVIPELAPPLAPEFSQGTITPMGAAAAGSMFSNSSSGSNGSLLFGGGSRNLSSDSQSSTTIPSATFNPSMSATALLQKAAQMGATAAASGSGSSITSPTMMASFSTLMQLQINNGWMFSSGGFGDQNNGSLISDLSRFGDQNMMTVDFLGINGETRQRQDDGVWKNWAEYAD
ncbi:hypothetical protein SLEP1_g10830 [Rubroshorea leprosula]|uniref:C2H2-type domain-containing protein n=1 Tax=Rubroshorea leprosula TaxID=152421 RepID=A0AAV5IF31_9ROSI|nr:hypothetical protein SLEP1_g10830 [Rubroshorea leprosula]